MSDQFVAEIRIFPFAFAPTGWALCNGQLLPISQNTALFSLLGTYYGGDGRSTFALPDLQGATPVHTGQGGGLSTYALGQTGGEQTVTLLETEIPAHSHLFKVSQSDGTDQTPQNEMLATAIGMKAYNDNSPDVSLAATSASLAGGSLPHNNMQPTLTLSFCIALQGVFPPR